MTNPPPPTNADIGFLLDDCLNNTVGLVHIITVSADGLLIAASKDLPRDRGDQLAAITSGLSSLCHGAAGLLECGYVTQNVLQTEGGFLFMMPVGTNAILTSLGRPDCDVGQVGFHLALLVEKVGAAIEPAPRTSPPQQP